MKALKLYEPGNLKVEDVDIPWIKEEEILIEVKAVGVCGSDIPRVLNKGAYYEGLTLGHEFAGVIAKVGDKITDWKEGQRVAVAPLVPCMQCAYCANGQYSLCDDYDYYGSRTDGAMAKYIKVNPNNMIEIPDNVSFEAGAMVDPAANAIHGLWAGSLKSGDRMAVFGLGAIGLFAIQFAKVLGASKIVAIDIHDEKLELAKKLGADITINSRENDPVKVIQEQLGGLDFAIDLSGSPIAQDQAVLSCDKKGKVVLLGISNSSLELSKESVNQILRYELSIHGSWNSFSSPFPGREWTYTTELMGEGKIIAEPIVSHRFTIDEGPEVFRKIRNKEIVFNKIMFFPN
ncbi:galactitol-1-phosphate 5-dehydrogenase [Aneurinibacillus terranovensis]|uniref:galactitol-1-phosphate 5-dehydrogenase n=1 Tax=Aneurinibacillus terranovensis TaxID=278991 RepID=UPI000413E069|nr:galactitol-1-phosphate 5-dehydrogenase [Aneurinibacillus terranovensis]